MDPPDDRLVVKIVWLIVTFMWLQMVTQNSRGTCQPCRSIYLGVASVLVTGSVVTGRRGGFSVF
jgi:hypothetical protein